MSPKLFRENLFVMEIQYFPIKALRRKYNSNGKACQDEICLKQHWCENNFLLSDHDCWPIPSMPHFYLKFSFVLSNPASTLSRKNRNSSSDSDGSDDKIHAWVHTQCSCAVLPEVACSKWQFPFSLSNIPIGYPCLEFVILAGKYRIFETLDRYLQ